MLHNSPEKLNFPIDLTDRDGNKYRLSHWMRSESTWDDNIARNHQAAFAWLSNISGTQLHVIGNHFGILPHQRREWHSPHHVNAARFWPMDEDNSSFYGSHSFDDGSDCPLEQMEYLQECFSSNTLILVRLNEPEKKDQRSLLRTKIQQAFASIVAQEKAEAAHHSQLLAKHTAAEAALIHTGAFFHGLWTAGTNFVEWVKNINALINPVQRRLRDIRSSYRALLRSNISGENFLTAYADERLKAEQRALVEALGFNPSNITLGHFYQALEIAELIWSDPGLQGDITRFAKNYANAQHTVELAEVGGGAAFEVLFTIVLAICTAGVGLAVSAASQGRQLVKFRKVGELLKEFAEQTKQVQQKAQGGGTKGGGRPSFSDFPVEEVEVPNPLDNEPRYTPKGKRPDEVDVLSNNDTISTGKKSVSNNVPTVTALNRSDLEQQLISRLGQNVKGNPLRQEYETKVAELAKYQQALTDHSTRDKAIANMANLPGSEKALAETANNARRQLGVKYKNLTPEPLRDYIYEVNLKRYGDPLGPNVDLLVQRGKTYSQIVESAARPNPDVDKLLNGFGKWLAKQPDDYVQKYIHLLNGSN